MKPATIKPVNDMAQMAQKMASFQSELIRFVVFFDRADARGFDEESTILVRMARQRLREAMDRLNAGT